jgi:hypothetical protein
MSKKKVVITKAKSKKGFMGAAPTKPYKEMSETERSNMIFDFTFFPFILGVPFLILLIFGKWGIFTFFVLSCSAFIGAIEAIPVILVFFLLMIFFKK